MMVFPIVMMMLMLVTGHLHYVFVPIFQFRQPDPNRIRVRCAGGLIRIGLQLSFNFLSYTHGLLMQGKGTVQRLFILIGPATGQGE